MKKSSTKVKSEILQKINIKKKFEIHGNKVCGYRGLNNNRLKIKI